MLEKQQTNNGYASMYHQNPRVRDAQNPYRTGVLIGNCWEDKFGMELATQPVSFSPIRDYPHSTYGVRYIF